MWNVNHPEIYKAVNDMAVLYKEHDNPEKAEPLLLEAAKGRRSKPVTLALTRYSHGTI